MIRFDNTREVTTAKHGAWYVEFELIHDAGAYWEVVRAAESREDNEDSPWIARDDLPSSVYMALYDRLQEMRRDEAAAEIEYPVGAYA